MLRALIRHLGWLCWLVSLASAQAAPRVLYLGDSLSMGAFGTTLDGRLRAAGMEVYTSVTGGATPYYWLSEFPAEEADIGHWRKTPQEDARFKQLPATPKLEALMADLKPTAVIVQTGVNLYAVLRSKRTTPAEAQTKVLSLLTKMAEAVTSRGAALYWITPPTSHAERYEPALQHSMLELTQRAVAKSGRIFDSYAVTTWKDPYPETDGIHYGPTEAAAWAEVVARDAIPYLLKAPLLTPAAPAKPAPGPGPVPPRARIVQDGPAAPVEADSATLTAEIRLVKKSDFTTPAEITYNNALAIYEWEILRVIEGRHAATRILVAHTIVRERKITSERDLKLGKTYIVQLVPLSNYPSVERWETKDTVSQDHDLGTIVYIPKM